MSGAGAAKILVVDDVPENVRLLEAVLTTRGYDVVSATDGGAALELAESANPDLEGFQRPVAAFNVVGVREPVAELSRS